MPDIAQIAQLYSTLRDRRYPTMLIVCDTPSALPADLMQQSSRGAGASYVDFVQEAATGSTEVVAGAFRRQHFLRWLRERARASGGIWVENGDALIATWPEREQREFFREFLKTESRAADGSAAPIVIASALASRYDLPDESRGWGMLVHV